MQAITGELTLSRSMQDAILAAIEGERIAALKAYQARWRRWSWFMAGVVMLLALVVGVESLIGLAFIGANGFYITNAVARNMLKSAGSTFAANVDAGTAAVINIYDDSVPADADASIGSSNLLAQLTCSSTAFSGDSDANPGGRLTFDTITADSSADNSGTASYFRILTQSGGTVCAQGPVGTSTPTLVLKPASITSGSTVSITSGTITLPEGP